MSKKIIISVSLVFTALVLLAVTAVIYSFTVVKPTTEAINKNLARFMARIIYIPEGIPAPIFGFNSTNYFWEMETPAGEVTGIRFSYTPAFTNGENKITATLEMPEQGDASIFTKVLPAVISDNQSLTSAQDPQKANLAASSQIGYSDIKLTLKPETSQTIKVVWEFDKNNLDRETLGYYTKLKRIPQSLLPVLHELPRIIIGLLGG